ncbi:hypothetical protein NDU88_009301 [Pleurodeles waltl]|uniref:Uncharacterized protein n=1 Tax=Pleurodeles waltl TaxID=8319 RepID=A0AAV7S006_PLEWA|nr:hypothetical protein NDU88_009301 [Pleurodeles waltl]
MADRETLEEEKYYNEFLQEELEQNLGDDVLESLDVSLAEHVCRHWDRGIVILHLMTLVRQECKSARFIGIDLKYRKKIELSQLSGYA